MCEDMIEMAIKMNELIRLLENSTSSEREKIIEQFVIHKNDVVPLLISILNNNSERQSWLAAIALAHIEDSRVISALIAALPNLNDVVQGMVIGILGDLKNEEAIRPLIKTLNSQNVFVQIASVRALAKIACSSSVRPLLAALEQAETPSLRYTLIEALGDFDDPQAIEAIQRYKNDEDRRVRRRVEHTLNKLTART
jgi:HEAT repeat protein